MSWIDLSTGINPWPYPVATLTIGDWASLPTTDQYKELCTAAKHYYGVGPETAVVVAPGTQALIQWLPYLASRPGKVLRVAVLSPTYTEHATTWSAAGHKVINVGTLADIVSIGADAAVVVNPNNPDGYTHPHEHLLNVSKHLNLLVIDEAFVDVYPQDSIVPLLCDLTDSDSSLKTVIVLRSFGKFFGLASVRLGFALTRQLVFAARLEAALGPWAVGRAVLRIGTTAMSDDRWIIATRRRLHTAAGDLDRVLRASGLVIAGGTALFRLVDCGTECDSIHTGLGRAGILVRTFPSLPSWLRFGLPGSIEEWQRLASTLHSLLASTGNGLCSEREE